MHTRTSLLTHLNELGITIQTHDHPPVFTVEEARAHTSFLPGAHVKNLFLKDKAGGLWLVTCLDEQLVKVNGLSRLLGSPRFSFAKPDVLREHLGIEPGSVTPFALINNENKQVKFVMDRQLLNYELMNVHPLVNTATVSLSPQDVVKFATTLGFDPIFVDLDATLTA